jgi:Lipopolysaccharide-assembly
MRALKLFFCCLAAAAFTGCAGYHLGPANGAVAGDKSVEVLPFNNQTLQPRLGDAITQAVRQRLQTDATFHLATSQPGDIVVTGVITRYAREGLSYLNTDVITPENYRVGLVAHVTIRERATGRLLLDKDLKAFSLVHVGTDLASAERQSLPLIASDFARELVQLLAEGAW